ncbi:5-oxoprolinase subunit PxpB [Mesobacillus jeotgali]|uniref:5-oxoprolinase subunit PxpB n=1 Tax=Mesobacillus jeotgali TaxID=129985 RepID=A0ABY9VM23_9BACI|nr:5-oxoprolinase subunit PxpB [Mesobacillus jeotgali]WNF23781.1 5-oxoprolinase subunit PxpB [Mesobacillus jeotgali]
MEFVISPLGDLAVVLSFGNEINEKTNRQIQLFVNKLENEKVRGIVEWVPAYTSLTIYYQPEVITYDSLKAELESVGKSTWQSEPDRPLVYEIPVCYGGEWGQDLAYVAEYHGLDEQEVIHLHSNREYLIHMMGFMPGFPYLGGLPENLAVPRLEIPRKSVIPGAVGIGGNQTGIYPDDVPSGWRIIGTTPVSFFDHEKENPFLFSSGHYIKFVPINQEQFTAIKQMGRDYQVKTYNKG